MKRIKGNKKGFTLVEVIVVLVILAILAAIAVPALTGYIEDSKEKAANLRARDVYVAAQAAVVSFYADDTEANKLNNIRFYSKNTGGGWGPFVDGGTFNVFTEEIGRYLGDDVKGFFVVYLKDQKEVTAVAYSETIPPSTYSPSKTTDDLKDLPEGQVWGIYRPEK